eukprot:CAMPEP_0113666132 /NCGR_PEP_ID=MMETSP0038_2-20120614/2696_1 /TAXON_ID=2898 /ORGANISM="Cryptomonas paramecium" /LENGTH=195 /DNA_ID=CAMNT_0000581573 /DNA_START=114 /DNA_END=701 /DNA_ORIENTATION=+ /assembly_acc=CAM_ASM_000170
MECSDHAESSLVPDSLVSGRRACEISYESAKQENALCNQHLSSTQNEMKGKPDPSRRLSSRRFSYENYQVMEMRGKDSLIVSASKVVFEPASKRPASFDDCCTASTDRNIGICNGRFNSQPTFCPAARRAAFIAAARANAYVPEADKKPCPGLLSISMTKLAPGWAAATGVLEAPLRVAGRLLRRLANTPRAHSQ